MFILFLLSFIYSIRFYYFFTLLNNVVPVLPGSPCDQSEVLQVEQNGQTSKQERHIPVGVQERYECSMALSFLTVLTVGSSSIYSRVRFLAGLGDIT